MSGNFAEIPVSMVAKRNIKEKFPLTEISLCFLEILMHMDISAKDEELASDWLFQWKFPEITVEISP